LALRLMSAGPSTAARPAIVAAESLANDPATMAVVGHSNSSASLAASQIYNTRHIVQIAPTSSAPLLNRAGPFTFRLVASDIHQAQFLAGVIAAGGARPRVAVFFVNDDYGRALEHELRARLGDQSVPIVYGAPYTEHEGFVDAASVVRAVANTHPAILVWLGRAPALLELLPALRRTMPLLRVLASDGVDNVATKSNPESAFIGVQYVSYLQLNGERAPISALRARLKARSGTPLSVETALSYDAVMLLATAAREVGTDRVAIRDYLTSLGNQRATYNGATGPIAFSADGEPQPSYFLAEVGALGPRSVVAKTPP
jgi:branched-chain amino acid transport system substrate-binding protein